MDCGRVNCAELGKCELEKCEILGCGRQELFCGELLLMIRSWRLDMMSKRLFGGLLDGDGVKRRRNRSGRKELTRLRIELRVAESRGYGPDQPDEPDRL
jgi:hypothetical protein